MAVIRLRAAWAAALTAALAACSSSDGPRDVRPSNVADLCAIYRDNPHWAEAASRAEARWGAPQEVKMAIIWRESTFRHDARPPYRRVLGVPTTRLSSAYGYSQAIDGTWKWYQDETGADDADRTRFTDAVDFVGWYVAKTRSSNGIPPQDAFNQYIAYHEGHQGYRNGAWRRNAQLQRAAAQVAQQAARYRAQRAQCSGFRVASR